jgi:hypothetical protein
MIQHNPNAGIAHKSLEICERCRLKQNLPSCSAREALPPVGSRSRVTGVALSRARHIEPLSPSPCEAVLVVACNPSITRRIASVAPSALAPFQLTSPYFHSYYLSPRQSSARPLEDNRQLLFPIIKPNVYKVAKTPKDAKKQQHLLDE